MSKDLIKNTKHYSIALLSIEANFTQNLVKLAQENFADYYDGYILNDNALPHITLCNFTAVEESIGLIWDLVKKELFNDNLIRFKGIYFDIEHNHNKEYIWTGLSVVRLSSIIRLQEKIYALLSAQDGCHPLTLYGDSYFPHLTFARLRNMDTIKTLKYIDNNIFIKTHIFRGSLGIIDKNGVYQQPIFQA
ncbi:hypothetical protein Trichorick_01763 (plasmid) [Candidatus Trichorickettsia mobilis]|uniref:hypothetical protein n=1 Tax=Candidatus Trichorickettsia mobilis TaxID=1346319 RepID=UPI002B262B4C|nr:hypothetical protein [Candidatus Trichorickettsia mobilis]WPY01840.1 hypothetical protein Trichorick_01763 [Candidatus Trichorickettsia mobilis]